MWNWKGELISSMDYKASALQYPGTEYWDFHRPHLHQVMMDKAIELGAIIHTKCRVVDVQCKPDGSAATAVLQDGSDHVGDLVIAADGISSPLRNIMVGRAEAPMPTGDMVYRMMLPCKKLLESHDLAEFVTTPQVNYWLGDKQHGVNYVLRRGELFNFALTAPDDIPPEKGNRMACSVQEVMDAYKGWEPRLIKLIGLAETAEKWRLCYRYSELPWSHPSGCFTMLGDAIHATAPYLASG